MKYVRGLVGCSLFALSFGFAEQTLAQSQLPPVTIDAPSPERARAKPARSTGTPRSTRRVTQRGPAPTQQDGPAPSPGPAVGAQANGPVTGYLAGQSATGTKTDTAILTTPQSISVVTKDQIADQGAQNLVEALRYTPSVTLDLYGATTIFDAIKLRGF